MEAPPGISRVQNSGTERSLETPVPRRLSSNKKEHLWDREGHGKLGWADDKVEGSRRSQNVAFHLTCGSLARYLR